MVGRVVSPLRIRRMLSAQPALKSSAVSGSSLARARAEMITRGVLPIAEGTKFSR